jgi:hypothetical protein
LKQISQLKRLTQYCLLHLYKYCWKNSKINTMSKKGFEKFINKEPKASAKREGFRQEKRRVKADARAAGEEAIR